MPMLEVLTWNMARRAKAWDFLSGVLMDGSDQPTVALLQEASPPDELGAIHRPGGIGAGRPWGSAVLGRGLVLTELDEVTTRYSKHPNSLHQTWPGAVAIAVASLPGGDSVTFVSVYGVIDRGYAITTMHRILSDLTPLLDSSHGRHVVVGGDFNCSTQLSRPHRARHRNLFERFETLGLVDLVASCRDSELDGCPCDDEPCRHVQTHRHSQSRVPWQDDYLFATSALADRLVGCDVVDGGQPDPWDFSDHCPIRAVFDI